jgi:predicted adenylyl cyclase CyaB
MVSPGATDMQNFEIKCRLRDRSAVEKRLRALRAKRQWSHKQRDTFFAVPSGWLKLREETGKSPEMIAYQRPVQVGGPRLSDYDVIKIKDPLRWKSLLLRVLPGAGTVRKTRTLWRYKHTRIHLDRVVGLGDFLELETVITKQSAAAAEAEAEALIHELRLDRADFIGVPYRDLLAVQAPQTP